MPTPPPTLMPGQDRLHVLFDGYAVPLAEAAGEFSFLFDAGGASTERIGTIQRLADEASAVTGELRQALGYVAFVSFDRDAAMALFAALDGVLGEMGETARTVQRHGGSEVEPAVREIARLYVDAIDVVSAALPLLRSVQKYAPRLLQSAASLVELERRANSVRAAGPASRDQADVAAHRAIHAHLARLLDGLVDLAGKIERLVP